MCPILSLRWQSRRTCTHLLRELQNYNSLLNNHQQDNVGSHQKRYPHPGKKGTPQQDGRRGKIAFRIKPHTHQRYSGGSNKILCTPGPSDSAETEPELCLSVSCRGTSQQWPATGAGPLAAADLGHAACGRSLLGGGHH